MQMYNSAMHYLYITLCVHHFFMVTFKIHLITILGTVLVLAWLSLYRYELVRIY